MNLAEFVYTVLLKPRPLRKLANAVICSIIPEYVRYGDIQIALNRHDPVVCGALALRQYEKLEAQFIRALVQPGMVVLDVGANVGYYTAICARRVGEAGSVISFEPDPINFRFLQKTVRQNHFENVRCLQKGLSDQSGTAMLHTSSSNRGDNRLYSNDLSDDVVDVEVATGDDSLESLGVQSVAFIKIDVQGYESHVLKGLARTLHRSPDAIILAEFWPHGLAAAGSDARELLDGFHRRGLNIYHLQAGPSLRQVTDFPQFVHQFPGRRYTNVVIARPEANLPCMVVR